MASFAQFLQDSGVYAAQSFMIVPRGGFNLVCLRDWMAVRAASRSLPKVSVFRNTAIKLEVAILQRKDFTIAFRFLKHLDQSGKVINATKWTPDDVPWFLTRLNWVFGAQTNIFFTLVDAKWITVQKALGPKISRDVFRKDIAPLKRRGADLTCFLVGDYAAMDTEAAGEYLPDEQVFVVVDQGNPPVFDLGEAFIGVMAHEIGHFLHHKRNMPGSGHHNRSGILLSSGMESLSLDKQLVTNFNAW